MFRSCVAVAVLGILALLTPQPVRADIVYNNLGTGGTFQSTGDHVLGVPPGSGFQWFAMPFTVASGPGFTLNSVTMALSRTVLGNFSIQILNDRGGTLGPGTNTGATFGAPSPAIPPTSGGGAAVTFTATSTTTLSGGTKYWMVGTATTGDYVWYLNNTGQSGTDKNISTDQGVTWSALSGVNTYDAYRVDGIALPEPGSWALGVLYTIGFVASVWRRYCKPTRFLAAQTV